MKRIIVADRRSDLRSEISRLENERNTAKATYDEEYLNYRTAFNDLAKSVSTAIRKSLPYSDNLRIEVGEGPFGRDGLEARISYPDSNSSTTSLKWDYSVSITKDGSVDRQSSSWSGLNVTTDAHIEDLKKSVAIIEALSKLDWKSMLLRNVPQWSEYIRTHVPGDGPISELKEELKIEDILDYVGKEVFLKGVRNSGKYFRGDVWYAIISATDKMVTLGEVSSYYISRSDSDFNHRLGSGSERKVRKADLLKYIVYPIVEA